LAPQEQDQWAVDASDDVGGVSVVLMVARAQLAQATSWRRRRRWRDGAHRDVTACSSSFALWDRGGAGGGGARRGREGLQFVTVRPRRTPGV